MQKDFFIFDPMNVAQFYPLFLKASKVSIDSRNVQPGDLFFAFSGDNFNAAEHAENAINNGALAVIVEQKKYENTDKNIFAVPSTLQFLQDLATYHRAQLNIPIIALTGSNGKTTTKELIHAVLSKKFQTQYTFGNLNNHIGVPLTLLSIKPWHEIAIIEMGANHQNEIAALCEIAKPNYGYITNFGKAHLEGFGGFEGVIKGKSEIYDYLFAHQQTVLINDADERQVEKTKNYPKKISFGLERSDYFFEPVEAGRCVGIKYKNESTNSNLTGAYNFTNLCAAASLGLYFGIEFKEIAAAISAYVPTNMRSQILEKDGKVFVLDTYNANPSSMTESLKNFASFYGTKTVIMGDMLELGNESQKEHQEILALAEALGFNEIYTIGNNFKAIENNHKAFSTAQDFVVYLETNTLTSENILLKGSRGIALEQILEHIK